jgi:hypothetical protein
VFVKVGDKVLVWKKNWYDKKKRSGTLVKIFEVDKKVVYRVYFYDKFGKYKDGCNIFTNLGETIEGDKLEERNDKLNDLGIS